MVVRNEQLVCLEPLANPLSDAAVPLAIGVDDLALVRRRLAWLGPVVRRRRTVGEHRGATGDDAGVVRLVRLHHPLRRLGPQQRVVVNEKQDVRRRQLGTLVPLHRRTGPSSLLVNKRHASADDSLDGSPIRVEVATGIDDHDLRRRPTLLDRQLDAGLKILQPLVRRDCQGPGESACRNVGHGGYALHRLVAGEFRVAATSKATFSDPCPLATPGKCRCCWHMKGSLLVTGAAGFIGSNFVRMMVERGHTDLVALDSLTYAGNLANFGDLLDAGKLTFEKVDIRDADAMSTVFEKHDVDRVAHFAAESHVDRSILGSADFLTTNVVGTGVLLDLAKKHDVSRFLNVGTDEVYGTLPEDQPDVKFTEETPLQPNSPYSASKAGGDCLCRAYYETHKMPIVITRCSNNYGPYQFPEKLIPLFVTNLMEGKQVPLYGDGMNIRDWLHVSDHCDAIATVLEKGEPGEVYNVGGNNEQTNRAITEKLIELCGRSWDEAVTYVEDRKGHDRRYAIDASKIKQTLGWEPARRWDEAIAETVEWYKTNQDWWKSIKSGAYRDYYESQYANR